MRTERTPTSALPAPLNGRDPAFLQRLMGYFRVASDVYHRGEVEGLDKVPMSGGYLLVGNHNGSFAAPDLLALLRHYIETFGAEEPVYGLGHGVFFNPVTERLVRKLGVIPAGWDSARLALREGCGVLVYPGGDVDSLKPFRERHTVKFAGRRGWVRLAIREQVPILPMASVGAHEVFIFLNEGRRTARLLGLKRLLRVELLPMALGFPLPLAPAGIGTIPLPSKVKVKIHNPIHLGLPPEAADDEATVERVSQQIQDLIQASIHELAAARRFPVLG